MQYQEEETYSKRFDLGPWKKLIHYAKPFHRHMLGIMIASSMTSIFDMMFPLLKMDAIDNLARTGDLTGLVPFIIKYALCMFGLVGSIFLFINLCGRVEVGLCRHIRRIAFKRLQELPFSFYDKTSVGYLIARLTSDTQRLGDTVAWGLLDILWSSTFVVIVSVTMFILNWKLTLITLAVVPLMAVITAVLPDADPEKLPRGAQDQLQDHRRVQRRHHGREDHQDPRARGRELSRNSRD